MDWRKEDIMITRMPSAQDGVWCAYNLGKQKKYEYFIHGKRKNSDFPFSFVIKYPSSPYNDNCL